MTRRPLNCLVLVLNIFCLTHALEQCSNEISLKMGVSSKFGNNIFKDVGTYYAANSSVYGNTITYDFDGNSNDNNTYWFQLVDKLKREGVPFVVTELLPTKGDNDQSFITFPVLASALIFFFNLKNTTNIVLSPQVITDIYMSKTTFWNDTSIQLLNPHVRLPNETIIVAAKYTTDDVDLLGLVLSSHSDIWAEEYSFGQWLFQNFTYFDKWSKMISFISSTPYSIGFTSYENANDSSNDNNKDKNKDGSKQPPPASVSVMNANGAVTDVSLRWINAAVRGFSKQNASSKDALDNGYPFVYFEYILINRTIQSVSCCAMKEFFGYIDFLYDYIKSASWSKYGYINLPSDWIQYIRANVLPLITCNETSAYADYQLSRKTAVLKGTVESWPIIVGVAAVVVGLTVSTIVGYGYYRAKQGNEQLWKIDEMEISMLEEKRKVNLSRLSINTYQSLDTSTKIPRAQNLNLTFGKWNRNDTVVVLTGLKLENTSVWSQTTKRLVYKFTRDFNHQNLCSLFGVSTMQSKSYLISQFCSKGTLNSVLENCPFELILDVKYSIANNVINGLKYLHSKFIVHGSLSSVTCFVDDTWCVKLADWAVFSIVSNEGQKTKKSQPSQANQTRNIDVSNAESDNLADLIKFLYLDPDSIPSSQPTKASDIFSCGMLLMEIFTRQLPYTEEVEMSQTTYVEIIRKKMKKEEECLPQMPKELPNEIRPLLSQMIGRSEWRPDIVTVAREIHSLSGNSNKTVVDIMMKLMEKHMEDLEEKVNERTSELMHVTDRMKDLLNEMLPPQIAEKFIRGETVKPEFYECATIFFSDIVGFTTISARSTPYQVMDLLNDLWKLFDSAIEKFDVYKVDTIGDAYMVASGLPVRNGVDHCSHVANFALFLTNESKSFQISHLPGESIRVRMGINSGPVTAGIVGHKMPQYCIFGDTVNTASRMESSSLPTKIHVSEFSHNLYQSYFPELFSFESRGEIEVKGKGRMITYWLLDSLKSKKVI